jgi:hypothetical protein
MPKKQQAMKTEQKNFIGTREFGQTASKKTSWFFQVPVAALYEVPCYRSWRAAAAD